MRSINSITPIILAAGDSTRMGFPKALLPIGDNTFLIHILRIAREIGLATPVVVLGRAAAIIQPLIQDRSSDITVNPEPDRGQLSSIQLGLSRLDARAQAGMIWPVDQPAVSENLVRRLSHLFIESKCLMAFPKYREQRGHPAIFHRSLFPEFLAASPGKGAKDVILRHLQDIAELPTDEYAVVNDIDTPSDYQALTGESIKAALARVRKV